MKMPHQEILLQAGAQRLVQQRITALCSVLNTALVLSLLCRHFIFIMGKSRNVCL